MVKYSTFSNETGDYIAVTLLSNEISNPKKLIFNFKTTEEGELFSFLLTSASITFDGKNWESLDKNISNILLFGSEKELHTISPIDLKNPISLLSNHKKIEDLKSIQFDGMGFALGEYIRRLWPNAEYGVLSNRYGEYVTVTITQNANNLLYPEKVIFYFLISTKEMQLFYQLDHMTIHYRGKESLYIGGWFAYIFLLEQQVKDIMKTTIQDIQPFIIK